MNRAVGVLIAVGALGVTATLLLFEGGPVEPQTQAAPVRTRAALVPRARSEPAAIVVAPAAPPLAVEHRSVATPPPAPEPTFDLAALLAHDDVAALAEVIQGGKLDLTALVARVLSSATPREERTFLIEALALGQTPAAQRALLSVVRDVLLPDDLLDLAHEALGRSRDPLPETLMHLHQTQGDPRAARRGSASRALGVLAREASDPALRDQLTESLLGELSETERPVRRLELVRALAETGSQLAGAPLARFLQDSASPQARAAAALGLSRVPGDGAQVSLLTLLAEGNPTDRVAAVEALARRSHTAEAVLALCEAAVDDQAPAVRAAAAQGLSAWVDGGQLPAGLLARARGALPARG